MLSILNKEESLISTINPEINTDCDEAKSGNIPPEDLSDLSTFAIEEDLLQTEDFLAFKGNFGNPKEPSILKVRPSKSKPDEIKQLMRTIQLSLSGRYGKGFGFYKAKCVTTKSFKVDVIHPWVKPEKDETMEEEKERLQNQQKVFDKFYERNVPKKSFMVRETAEMYKTITLPHIEAIPVNDIQWVCFIYF